jgi:hypothetical protein
LTRQQQTSDGHCEQATQVDRPALRQENPEIGKVSMNEAIVAVEARVKRYDRQLKGSVGVATSSYNQALAVRAEARAILELLRALKGGEATWRHQT